MNEQTDKKQYREPNGNEQREKLVALPRNTLDFMQKAMYASGTIYTGWGIDNLVNGPPFEFWRNASISLSFLCGVTLIAFAAILDWHQSRGY